MREDPLPTQRGYPPQLLLTSLVDDKRYPAAEIRTLYHERWEIELGFGEIKTDMLERLETIRSKSPSGVAQEMWGLLLAYNLVRLEIERVAAELDVLPISHQLPWLPSPRSSSSNGTSPPSSRREGTPRGSSTTTDRLRQFLLPPRRPGVSFREP